MLKVAKFGGSSCASSEQFEKVKNIVMADRDRKYIVVSAPGKRDSRDIKVTDLFISLYWAVQEKKKVESIVEKIKKRYQEIIDNLSLSISLDEDFAEIVGKLKEGASLDYAASRGE